MVVIGTGITGLSAAFHLEKLGVKQILLAGPDSEGTSSANTSGIIAGGMSDNFTRVSHAHGVDFAKDLWSFGNSAFDALTDFSKRESIPCKLGGRLRFITSEQELTEAKLAVSQMNSAGFLSKLILRGDSENCNYFEKLSRRVLAVQDEGHRGGFIDCKKIVKALSSKVKCPRIPSIKGLTATAENLIVTDSNNNTHQIELALFANHLDIRSFIPEIKEALVSVADQWISCDEKKSSDQNNWNEEGIVYSANHSYEWGVKSSSDTWHLGGGRYLRPMAGIEAEKPSCHEKIDLHLVEQFGKTFTFDSNLKRKSSHPILDCRPCDELPIIGPMFGDSRLLMSTGYMGDGLSMAFYAGQCLAELIVHGKCDNLPRRLWPERLRSIDAT